MVQKLGHCDCITALINNINIGLQIGFCEIPETINLGKRDFDEYYITKLIPVLIYDIKYSRCGTNNDKINFNTHTSVWTIKWAFILNNMGE